MALEPVHDPMPREPVAPALEDCCRSGCAPCVFDLYDDAMDRYRVQLAAWRQRHPGQAAATSPTPG
jgi:hypothetical protein